jgi:transposase InsO family protein
VTTFCAEHQITRKTFYAILARAKTEGQAAALEPRSRRPHTSPTKITDDVKQQAVDVRAALERSGLDHGPISVHDKMKKMGLTTPSIASLARIFREKGVARLEPKKKPRAAYRRFVYPAPNACWQMDATEYVLTAGRKCVIFQLVDDHSRLEVASHVADGETSEGALAVFTKAVAAYGVPQRLLTDNGMALNPTRRGWTGQLVTYVTSLGVEAITGKPYKPTTQGKNERLHQTLFRWLDKQPLAASIDELQAQVDTFDGIYNTERPHQGLPGRITPQQAWDATPVAEPPRPQATPPATPTHPTTQHREYIAKVSTRGAACVRGVAYQIGHHQTGRYTCAIIQGNTISFYDTTTGELLIEHPLPEPGIKYVGNGQLRGNSKPKPSPKS